MLLYLDAKQHGQNQLAKTRAFWGLTLKAKQILKDYLKYYVKSRSQGKKRGFGFQMYRKNRSRDSRKNLDSSYLHSSITKSNQSMSHKTNR